MKASDKLPQQLVHVRCRRCRKNAGVWNGKADGTGRWQNNHRNRCRCDPPPSLPEGAELERLVAEAWLLIDPTGAKKWTFVAAKKYGGRAPKSVSK